MVPSKRERLKRRARSLNELFTLLNPHTGVGASADGCTQAFMLDGRQKRP